MRNTALQNKPNAHEVVDDWDNEKHAIDAIKHPTMTRQYAADVLEPQLAFELRFCEVADGTDDTRHATEECALPESNRQP